MREQKAKGQLQTELIILTFKQNERGGRPSMKKALAHYPTVQNCVTEEMCCEVGVPGSVS